MRKLLTLKECIILLVIVIICLIFILFPRNANSAEIIFTNQKKDISLAYEGCYTFMDMTFEVKDHDIRVLSSDCPGQDCVHEGYASKNGGVIICVPNQVVVRLKEGAEFDAVV
jgi:hypothetical protein